MMGKSGSSSNKEGLIPRSLQQIFETKQSLEQQGWKYDMQVNEEDLNLVQHLIVDYYAFTTYVKPTFRYLCWKSTMKLYVTCCQQIDHLLIRQNNTL